MYNKLIVTVLNHQAGDKLADITRKAGAAGGTILFGRGFSNSTLLQLLSLSDVEKDILLTLVTEDQLESVFSAIISAPIFDKKHTGDAFVVETGGTLMTKDIQHVLINIIVNRGYADDIMNAARKEGARGGTILHAKGTGKPDDEKFFGITIVPEKEQILIVTEKNEADKIIKAINALPFLKEKGTGIIYVTPIIRYESLGNSDNK